jgi:hypothetical protein
VAAVFPVFFGWFFLLLHDQLEMAMVAALIATAVLLYLGVRLKERSYYYAMGPSIAGVFIAAVLLPSDGMIAWLDWAPAAVSTSVSSVWDNMITWVACAAAALAAGLLFVAADARGKRTMRGAANLGWLILSVAAVSIAWPGGALHLLYCVTVVGATAVLIAWRSNRGQRDVLELFVQGSALLASTAAVVMAALVSVIGLSVVVVGAFFRRPTGWCGCRNGVAVPGVWLTGSLCWGHCWLSTVYSPGLRLVWVPALVLY